MIQARRARDDMVRTQIAARGLHDSVVLDAIGSVPREAFLPTELGEFAYEDTPLPIECGQTISQPYVVALMTAALKLRSGDRVLEIGTGSGYAAAVLARVAREVLTIERHEELARFAAENLERAGFDNVRVRHGDGTLGWPEEAPFDGIVVAAGGPEVPHSLLEQLAIGGRLVIPIGADRTTQELVRVTRVAEDRYEHENLGGVRFVPLIGAEGWQSERGERQTWTGELHPTPSRERSVAQLLHETVEPFSSIEDASLGPLLDRIGDARVVLLGEATHGTAEFYSMRARITRELVEQRDFTIVAVEADWPDAARVNHWVQGTEPLVDERHPAWHAFARFPTWMWRNDEARALIEWLREHDAGVLEEEHKVGFYGLDLYSLFASIRAVLDYLDQVDPAAAKIARERYGCLTPWEGDPQTYGRAAVTGAYRICAKEAVAILEDMLARQVEYAQRDGHGFLDAAQNAALVANAERYYRVMYQGANESWNLRDHHMFHTLETLLDFHGPESKAVVWEHNSHLGDAAATEMGARGQLNVGHLCRRLFGDQVYSIGFGTDHGTVAAAAEWDGPMQVMDVKPGVEDSYEHLCHESGVPAFFLPLRRPARAAVREELSRPRLERAIGVIYRPETELQSHYFQAALPEQFDEWIWIDRTRAVTPISNVEARRLHPGHPFALS